MIVAIDPPPHDPARPALSKNFLRSNIGNWDERCRRVVKELIDRMTPLERGEFVPDVAQRLPMLMILEMMKIPPAITPPAAPGGTTVGTDDPEYQVGSSLESRRQGNFAIYDVAAAGPEAPRRRRQRPAHRDGQRRRNGRATVRRDSVSPAICLCSPKSKPPAPRSAMRSSKCCATRRAAQAARPARAPAGRDRGDPALDQPGPPLSAHRHPRCRDPRAQDSQGRQDHDLDAVGEPRRGGVCRARPVRHYAHAQRASRLRLRRAFLPRRPPRAPGAARDGGRAAAALCPTSNSPGRPNACTQFSCSDPSACRSNSPRSRFQDNPPPPEASATLVAAPIESEY